MIFIFDFFKFTLFFEIFKSNAVLKFLNCNILNFYLSQFHGLKSYKVSLIPKVEYPWSISDVTSAL